ncbi:MAG: hypothetical protein MMC33_003416 [Icmadophila ericetorum]|nr:hypothetical protein [Icmadophila ericetorum]
MSPAAPPFTLQLALPSDIPILSKIGAEAFVNDRQTQMKDYGKTSSYMEDHGLGALEGYISSPKCVVIKAVDHVSSQIMGLVTWGFRGFEPEEVKEFERCTGLAVDRDMDALDGRKDLSWQGEKIAVNSTETPVEVDSDASKTEAAVDGTTVDAPTKSNEDPIARLQALTNHDMTNWSEKLMPPGTRCLFVIGLSVAPVWQHQGVGSALLEWGKSTAAKADTFCWVHSSEPAWGMYAKAGFEVVGTLDVDLDEYAPGPSPDREGKWGHYVFRYMKWSPKNVRS